MALGDWVRHEGTIGQGGTKFDHISDEQFIMLVRDIQYDDVVKNRVRFFNSMYDVAMNNSGSYIPMSNNYELRQEPPDPRVVNQYKRRMNIK